MIAGLVSLKISAFFTTTVNVLYVHYIYNVFNHNHIPIYSHLKKRAPIALT